jgi:hypothetical protein
MQSSQTDFMTNLASSLAATFSQNNQYRSQAE